MAMGKILAISAAGLVVVIAVANWPSSKKEGAFVEPKPTIDIPHLIDRVVEVVEVAPSVVEREDLVEVAVLKPLSDDKELPTDADRMNQLFQPFPPTLPFIEILSFSSRVDWVTGRAAYLGDYSSHYQTSKHFISRSLNGVGVYFSDKVSKGDRFTVYRKDRPIEFHLVLDLSRLKLWLYCYDKVDNSRFLLKTYPVCAGKYDPKRPSGSLTPCGLYAIGKECAVYDENIKGNFKNEVRDLITIYGKRWIPLGREIAHCTGASKGLGLHGVPWTRNLETGEIYEIRECIGHYESEGCIRLLSEDIEELYAVIVSKPAYIHIVRDFTEANIPGKDLVF